MNCKQCIHEKVCPHLSGTDANKCIQFTAKKPRYWTFYNAKLGTVARLSEEQAIIYAKFYKIDFPIWDEYYQCNDKCSLTNLRGDMFLFARF